MEQLIRGRKAEPSQLGFGRRSGVTYLTFLGTMFMFTSLDAWRLRLFLSVGVVICLNAMNAEAAIITGEAATASSVQGARTGQKAVDNSGITANGSNLATDGDFEHNSTNSDMWQTLNGQNQGFALGQTLTIDLGALYDLDGMRIWNYNEGNGTPGGDGTDTSVSMYDLETSADAITWILRQDDQSLAQAPLFGSPGYDGVYTAVDWDNTRYVRITVVDTYRALDDTAGLAEVMFSGTVPVPEPGSIVVASIGFIGLLASWRRSQRRSSMPA